MANDFSGDSRCKALWRFESGALTIDSKGANTLTAVNAPAANGSDFKEGAASAALVYASHQYFSIPDASLDADFPLKNGDAVQKATFCFFVKPASFASNTTPQTLIGHPGYSPGTYKFFAVLAGSGNNLLLYWGYSSGSSLYSFDTGIQLLTGAWWHIAIRVDGINKVLNVRAWKYADSSLETYSITPGSVMSIAATELRIGGTIQSDTAYSFDGLIDEVVVFNDLLSDVEIDKIRNGTFNPIYVGQVHLTLTPNSEYSGPLGTVVAVPGSKTATRLYYSAGKWNLNITPAPSARWEYFLPGGPALLERQHGNDYYRWYYPVAGSTFTPPSPQGVAQFASDPLSAQTISGIVKGQNYAMVSQPGVACRAIIIRVFSGDGLTERGILLEHLPQTPVSRFAGNFYSLIFENRHFPPPMQLNPVVCQDGDIIVIELGIMCFDVGGDLAVVGAWNSGSVDLPEDETSRTMIAGPDAANTAVGGVNSWIEFSQVIQFYGGPRVLLRTAGQTSLAARVAPTNVCALIMGTDGAVVKPGVDDLTGHGIVDLTFLSGDPPYASMLSYYPLQPSVSFVTTEVIGSVTALVTLVGSVGITVTPEGVIAFTVPDVLDVVGSVSVRVRPTGTISEVGPSIHAVIGSVKLKIGVHGVVGGVLPISPPSLSVVGAVHVRIGMAGVVTIATSSTLAVIGSVKICVGSFRVPELTVVHFSSPGTLPLTAITGSIGIRVAPAGVIARSSPSSLAVIGSIQICVGAFRIPELTVVHLLPPVDMVLAAITGSVKVDVGPAGVIVLSTPSVYAVPVSRPIEDATIKIRVAGVIAFISPQILEVIGGIEVTVGVGGGAIDPGVFDTYTLTGSKSEPSIYSAWNFNSYAKHKGQYFAAGMDGVYLLEGDTDDGDEIHAGVRIGPFNAGSDREKRIRLLRLGGKTTGAEVRVSNNNGSSGYYDVKEGRAAVSREIQGRELLVDIADFTTLDHLEIALLVLAKR